jgi:hypothetical protein
VTPVDTFFYRARGNRDRDSSSGTQPFRVMAVSCFCLSGLVMSPSQPSERGHVQSTLNCRHLTQHTRDIHGCQLILASSEEEFGSNAGKALIVSKVTEPASFVHEG